MANVSRSVGLLLMIVGVGGYVMTGMASPTALIPAAFGLVISMLGFYARHEDNRRTAMHLAMGIAMVGVLGSVSGLLSIPALISGEVALPAAVVSRSAMAVILLVYLAMGFNSFRQARQGR
ncbi:MAG: hypothetical protein EXQ49_08275 [Acidobacteria bacterium]|nr:hypothetical protein [Acidobacteriota bacterium]